MAGPVVAMPRGGAAMFVVPATAGFHSVLSVCNGKQSFRAPQAIESFARFEPHRDAQAIESFAPSEPHREAQAIEAFAELLKPHRAPQAIERVAPANPHRAPLPIQRGSRVTPQRRRAGGSA